MRRREIFSDFRGGLWLDDITKFSTGEPRKKIPPRFLSLAENIVIDNNGMIKTRCGMRYATESPVVPEFMTVLNQFKFFLGRTAGSLWSYSNPIGDPGTWTEERTAALIPGTLSDLAAFEGIIYLATGTIPNSIFSFDPVTLAFSAVADSPPGIDYLLVHNDRLWGFGADGTFQASVVADPTNWTDGYSKTLDDSNAQIQGTGSLDGDLYLFTNQGIWLHSGYAESEFSTVLLTTDGKMGGRTRRTVQAVNLSGKGRALLFVDVFGRIRGVNRSGVFDVNEGVGQIYNSSTNVLGAASYLSDSGLYLVLSEALSPTGILAVDCRKPFPGPAGDFQWPVTKFRHGNPAVTEFSFLGTQTGGLGESGRLRNLIFANATGAIARPVFSFLQVDRGNSSFKADDTLGSAGNYWSQVQGKIRLAPFDARSTDFKTWQNMVIKTNEPGSHMVNFTGNQYLDETLSPSSTVPFSSPVRKECNFDLSGFTEITQIELNLYETTVELTPSSKNHYLELRELKLDYDL